MDNIKNLERRIWKTEEFKDKLSLPVDSILILQNQIAIMQSLKQLLEQQGEKMKDFPDADTMK